MRSCREPAFRSGATRNHKRASRVERTQQPNPTRTPPPFSLSCLGVGDGPVAIGRGPLLANGNAGLHRTRGGRVKERGAEGNGKVVHHRRVRHRVPNAVIVQRSQVKRSPVGDWGAVLRDGRRHRRCGRAGFSRSRRASRHRRGFSGERNRRRRRRGPD